MTKEKFEFGCDLDVVLKAKKESLDWSEEEGIDKIRQQNITCTSVKELTGISVLGSAYLTMKYVINARKKYARSKLNLIDQDFLEVDEEGNAVDPAHTMLFIKRKDDGVEWPLPITKNDRSISITLEQEVDVEFVEDDNLFFTNKEDKIVTGVRTIPFMTLYRICEPVKAIYSEIGNPVLIKGEYYDGLLAPVFGYSNKDSKGLSVEPQNIVECSLDFLKKNIKINKNSLLEWLEKHSDMSGHELKVELMNNGFEIENKDENGKIDQFL